VWKDSSLPTCTISGNPTNWTTSATLTVNGYDTSGTLAASPYSWTSSTSGFSTTQTKGVTSNGTYTAYVKDAEGNVGSCSVKVTYIDTEPPTASIDSLSGSTLTLSYSDNIGVIKYSFQKYYPSSSVAYTDIDSTTSGTKTQSISTTGVGIYRLIVQDAAGNTTTASKNIYSVVYNPNGGTGAPSLQYKLQNQDLTLSSTVPSRSGYKFLGWSTSSTATSATYSAGSTYTTNASTTLYAVWKDTTVPTCTITENPTTWTTSATLTVTGSDSSGTLAASPYSWTSSTSGFSTTNTKVVTSNNTYTAYVKDAAGNVGSCQIEVTNIDTEPPTASIDSLSGSTLTLSYSDNIGVVKYYFGGNNPSTTGVTYTAIPSGKNGKSDILTEKIDVAATYYFAVQDAAGNTTVTNKEVYSIRYDANGGSGAPSKQLKLYGQNLTLSSTVPTRDGYEFLGWNTSSTATSATYSASSTYSENENTILYAIWKPTDFGTNYGYPKYQITAGVYTYRVEGKCNVYGGACDENSCDVIGSIPVGTDIYYVEKGSYSSGNVYFINVYFNVKDISSPGAAYNSQGACKGYGVAPPKMIEYDGETYIYARMAARTSTNANGDTCTTNMPIDGHCYDCGDGTFKPTCN
ncbi:MAG: InlB B-repeat-containing protein, partial [Clostridia bacterium]|nr:InlB B-repeat-containing protein [Clostridia bacterium]